MKKINKENVIEVSKIDIKLKKKYLKKNIRKTKIKQKKHQTYVLDFSMKKL